MMVRKAGARRSRRRVDRSFARKFNVMSQRTRELKYKENIVSISQSATSTVSLLTQVAQGDTDTNRNGDQLMIHNVVLDVSAAIDGTVAPDNTNIVRMIVFQWHPQSGISTLPTATQILQDPTTNPVLSSYNHDTRWNYSVILDYVFTLSIEGSRVQQRKFVLTRIPRRKLQFVGATTDGTNHLYILSVSDSTTVDHPSYNFNSKVLFYDN